MLESLFHAVVTELNTMSILGLQGSIAFPALTILVLGTVRIVNLALESVRY